MGAPECFFDAKEVRKAVSETWGMMVTASAFGLLGKDPPKRALSVEDGGHRLDCLEGSIFALTDSINGDPDHR
jgi:hypothetical protein